MIKVKILYGNHKVKKTIETELLTLPEKFNLIRIEENGVQRDLEVSYVIHKLDQNNQFESILVSCFAQYDDESE